MGSTRCACTAAARSEPRYFTTSSSRGRLAAAWLAAFLTVAAMTHASNGFFMNWIGNQTGEGFEYHVLAVALALGVVIAGSGAFSVDRALASRAR